MPKATKEFFDEFPKYVSKMKEDLPDVVNGFMNLFQKTMKDGVISSKEKEFVALGISVAMRCTPCINLHVQKCLAAGANRAEILEAASVAVMMTGGPAYTHISQVIKALDVLSK